MSLTLVIIQFLSLCSGTAEGTGCDVFTSSEAVCPGQDAVFSCTSYDNLAPYGHTAWVVSEDTAPQEGCALIHNQWSESQNIVHCGSFLGRAIAEFPTDCFNSELTVTATPALNNTSVECLFVPILGNRRVGSGTLQVIGPAETNIREKTHISTGGSLASHRVVIRWNVTEKRNISRYIIRVHPSILPCGDKVDVSGGVCVVEEGDSGFKSREFSLQLELRVEYEVTVSTVNCDTQAGNESNSIRILLQTPGIPACQTRSHYRNDTLCQIEVTWDKQHEFSDSLSAVESYHVMIDPAITPPIVLSATSSCCSDECYYSFNHISIQLNSNISVMITAGSAVGMSQPALCNAQPIGITSPVSVDSTSGPHVAVLIGFLPNHRSKHCNLSYGYNATLQSSSLSVKEGDYKIEYALHPLVAGVTYNYNVSCSVVFELDGHVSEFTDQGMFTAGCFLRDLIPKESAHVVFFNQLCLELPNGLVCYSGNLPGATAVYICHKDYALHGDSSRVCGEDGLWSGQVSLCLLHTDSNSTDITTAPVSSKGDCADSSLPIVTVVAVPVTTSIAVCIISCLIGTLLHRTLSRCSSCCKMGAKRRSALPGHYYDEITLNTPTQSAPGPRPPTRITSHNVQIVTTPNEAYMQVNSTGTR